MLLPRLADLLVLHPTRHAIPVYDRERRLIPFQGGHLEVFITRTGPAADGSQEPRLFVLKFPGKEGRAETMNAHPLDYWRDIPAEVWALNPPGYGGSTGPATLKTIPDAARTVFAAFEREAAGRPTVLSGFSMGTWSALFLAAEFPVSGLILRNTSSPRTLIGHRYGWHGLWLGSHLIATQVPRVLDSIVNARQCHPPAVFLVSGKDRVAPPRYQQPVIDAYAGPKQVLHLPRAGHTSGLTKREQGIYGQLLGWLRTRVLGPWEDAEEPAVPAESDHGVWVVNSPR